jgi:hypothetical protein
MTRERGKDHAYHIHGDGGIRSTAHLGDVAEAPCNSDVCHVFPAASLSTCRREWVLVGMLAGQRGVQLA